MSAILATLTFAADPALPGVDDLRVALAETAPVVRDWDPAGFRAPRLAPGEGVRVHLASGRALRVAVRGDAHASGDLVFRVGDGQGLRRTVRPRVEADAYVLPAGSAPRLVELVRPAGARGAVALDIATGDFAMDDAGLSYDRAVPLAGPERRLNWQETTHQDIRLLGGATRHGGPLRDARAEIRDYVIRRRNAPTVLRLDGPLRLRIETRLLPEETSVLYRPYRIEWALDGAAQRPLTFEASWDLRRAYAWDGGSPAAVTGAQSGYIDIPTGRHLLRLVPSRDLLMRIDALGGTLAAPGANAAPGLSRATEVAARRGRTQRSDVTWGGLASAKPARLSQELSAAELEHHARNLARTNTLSGSGMLAADLLRVRAGRLPQVGNVAAAADRFSGAYGFFRALEPLNGTGAGRVLWDAPPALPEPSETPRSGPGVAVPHEVLLAGLLAGRFHVVPRQGGLSYVVPERTASARLRLIVDREGHAGALRIRLAADGHAPVEIDLDPRADGIIRRASAAAIGLSRAARLESVTEDAFARAYLAAEGLPRAERGALAALDLILDHPVSRLRVTAEAASGAPVRIALAARASRQSQLDAPAFLAERDALGADAARHLFFHMLRSAVGCSAWLADPSRCGVASVPGDRTAQAELYNDLVPLLRLLRSRERLVFDGIRDTAPAIAPVEISDPVQAGRLVQSGRAWLQQGQPLAALEDFTRALRSAPEGGGAPALLGQVAALDALGEVFLSDRMLRRAALDCGRVGAAARAALDTRYADEGDLDRRLGVEVRRLICAGSARDLDRLTALLVEDGRDDDALRLDALSQVDRAPGLASAAARAGWPGSRFAPALPTGHTVAGAGLVLESAGALPVAVPARDLVSQWYRATPTRPAVFQASATGRLELSIRPIHPGGGTAPLDGAVRIDSAAGSGLRAITGNRVSPGLDLLSGGGALGTETSWQRSVAPGERVTIRPLGFDVAVDARLVPGVAAPTAPEPTLSDLSRLSMAYRADPVGQAALLPRATRLGGPAAGRPRALARLWLAIRDAARWERIERVTSSAGITELETPGQPFDSPRLRTRAALSRGFLSDARNITADSTLVMRRRAEDAASIAAELSLATLPASDVPEIRVRITDDRGSAQDIILGPDRRVAPMTLDFGAGDSAVRLRLAQPAVNSFVQLRTTGPQDAIVSSDTGGARRIFNVATVDEPVRYIPPVAEVVRVDTWLEGRVQSEVVVAAPNAPLEVLPTPGEDRALVRVFRLVPYVSSADPPEFQWGADTEAVASARGAVVALPRLDPAGALALAYPDALVGGRRVELLPGRHGTWSLGVELSRRATGDGADTSRDGRLEFSVRYRRYWLGTDLYDSAELILQPRETGPAVLGLRGRLTWPDRLGGTTFGVDASLFAQGLDRTAWRLRLGVDAEREYALTETLDLSLSGGLFLSALERGIARPGDPRVDADVWSTYLDDHRSGLFAAAKLDWQPHDDLRGFAELSLRSNGGGDLLSLDQARIEAGLHHYRGGLRFGITAEHRVFLNDADRAGRSSRSALDLDIAWERWLRKQRRVELGGTLGRRSDRDGLSGAIYLTYHLGSGFEGHAPDSVAFRDLREDALYRRLEERYGRD